MAVKTTKDVQRAVSESLKANPGDQKRYFVAVLADGRKLTERQCRWVDVPLHEIVVLKLVMLGRKYIIERKNCPGFVEYVQFKTAQRGLRGVLGKPDRTASRCIGWTNGEHEFVIRVNEKTGERVGEVEAYPLRQGHLHPQSKLLKKPNNIIIPNPTIVVADHD